MPDTQNSTKSAPGISRILGQLTDSLLTRLEIASIEFSVARKNAQKAAIFAVLSSIFGLFALVFISVALLVVFWDDHRVFVSSALAIFYTVVFFCFLGKARNYASSLPFAFEESKQILKAHVNSLRGALRTEDAPEGQDASEIQEKQSQEKENASK